MNQSKRIRNALIIIAEYAGIDGDHHKAWVIDQVARILAGDDYTQFVSDVRSGADGPNTYDWDVGVPP